jgi:hypothetical protein
MDREKEAKIKRRISNSSISNAVVGLNLCRRVSRD